MPTRTVYPCGSSPMGTWLSSICSSFPILVPQINKPVPNLCSMKLAVAGTAVCDSIKRPTMQCVLFALSYDQQFENALKPDWYNLLVSYFLWCYGVFWLVGILFCTQSMSWPSQTWHWKALEDFMRHAKLCDELLAHFTQQYRDREMYYLARERSRGRRDMLTAIVDSYDKAKIMLPRYPHGGRNPKKRDYEKSRRVLVWLVNIFSLCPFYIYISVLLILLISSHHGSGTHLTLTAVIMHGHGCYMFLCWESMPGGSNWTWECVPKLFSITVFSALHYINLLDYERIIWRCYQVTV